MSIIKSLRLAETIIRDIEKYASQNDTTFNNQAVVILREYFVKREFKDITIANEQYFPIHLSNKELIIILEDFIQNVSAGHNCSAKIRKDCGGKGVDFQINFFTENKNIDVRKKRYSFSISGNWRLVNIFEHWIYIDLEKDSNVQEHCKELTEFKLQTIKNIIEENTSLQNKPKKNPNFRDGKWKIILERTYPILK